MLHQVSFLYNLSLLISDRAFDLQKAFHNKFLHKPLHESNRLKQNTNLFSSLRKKY